MAYPVLLSALLGFSLLALLNFNLLAMLGPGACVAHCASALVAVLLCLLCPLFPV
jgi:hypothetical protein